MGLSININQKTPRQKRLLSFMLRIGLFLRVFKGVRIVVIGTDNQATVADFARAVENIKVPIAFKCYPTYLKEIRTRRRIVSLVFTL